MLSNSSESDAHEVEPERELREAAEAARAAVAAAPNDEDAAIRLRDAVQGYSRAYASEPKEAAPLAPAVEEARQLMAEGALEPAEILLRKHLAIARNDPHAMHLMGEIAAYCDLPEDADRILQQSARIHATSTDAWVDLAMTLYRIALTKDYPDFVHRAVAALDEALSLDPAREDALRLKASILVLTRGLDAALTAYQRLLALNPHISMDWLNYGYLLKSMARFGDGLAAYRTALALDPENGSAWWALADLKVARLFDSDVGEMEQVLKTPDLDDPARVQISFALFKAFDQGKLYERAAQQLERGSKLRRSIQVPESDVVTGDAQFNSTVFNSQFFEERRDWGEARPGPIFIVGMPRSGSTLVEQILSSHPAVEGTEELFILHQFSMELAARYPGRRPAEIVRAITRDEFADMGRRYIELARRSRRTERPFFTDKNPSNWRYTGLIHCMLPNARIIDVRRNPMDCCFGNYSQHFQVGANFSYDQRELGRFYNDYVRTMRHFDEVLPGMVHRVIHDDLVEDFEAEVRRLLDYLGLPFDDACLRFYETERPILTPSSEQVRQPINRSGFGKWRNYEPWLGDLKEALGSTIDNWRA